MGANYGFGTGLFLETSPWIFTSKALINMMPMNSLFSSVWTPMILITWGVVEVWIGEGEEAEMYGLINLA
jgi:hypothetical protein